MHESGGNYLDIYRIKIGMTALESVESRMRQLSAFSGVPLPFECHYAARVDDCRRVESILHQLFSEHRLNPRREFFRLEPEKAVLALSIGGFEEVTPGLVLADAEEQKVLEKEKARRPRISLDALDIKPGAQLTFSRDESVTATVLPGNQVVYEGQAMSLSSAAMQALQKLGYRSQSVSGSEYWMYEGELLGERRNRMEARRYSIQRRSGFLESPSAKRSQTRFAFFPRLD